MDTVVEHLKDQLVTLSPSEKAELAYFLLSSLDPDEDDVEAAWDAEAACPGHPIGTSRWPTRRSAPR